MVNMFLAFKSAFCVIFHTCVWSNFFSVNVTRAPFLMPWWACTLLVVMFGKQILFLRGCSRKVLLVLKYGTTLSPGALEGALLCPKSRWFWKVATRGLLAIRVWFVYLAKQLCSFLCVLPAHSKSGQIGVCVWVLYNLRGSCIYLVRC